MGILKISNPEQIEDVKSALGIIDEIFVSQIIFKTEKANSCCRCGKIYYSNNNKAKYCDDCKADYNKIRNEKRKANSCRYLHKRILDGLGYHDKQFRELFRIESNYYWDIVNGKEPKQMPAGYRSEIKTEKQYMKWLEIMYKIVGDNK